MRCGKAQRLISAAMDAPLAECSAADLRGHLQGCPGCRAFSEGLVAITERLDTIVSPAPRFGFTERLMRRIDAEAQPVSRPRRAIGWFRPAPIALGAFAFCFGVWTTLLTFGQDNAASAAEPPVEQLAAGVIGTFSDESFEGTLAEMLAEWEADQ